MNDYKCEIKKAENGYVVTYPEQLDDDTLVNRSIVFQDSSISEYEDRVSFSSQETEEAEKYALSQALLWLADYFGFSENKYGNTNIGITWNREGRKYEGSSDELVDSEEEQYTPEESDEEPYIHTDEDAPPENEIVDLDNEIEEVDSLIFNKKKQSRDIPVKEK